MNGFKLKMTCIAIVFASLLSCSNSTQEKKTGETALQKSWEQIAKDARGSTVIFMKYLGDKKANRFMDEVTIPLLKERFDITLKIIPGQGNTIVANLMSEKEAGVEVGETDLVWINGETFYQLKQIQGLFGPFAAKLPNSKYIDYNDPTIKYDFQEDIAGYEAPWSKASFIGITDTARVKNIPVSMQDFEAYWKANPGKFTIPLDFSGYTLLKSWLVELAGGMAVLDGPFNQAKYDKYTALLWDFINRNKANFWKQGKTFPASNVTVAQMFGSGELNFGFSFGVAAIDKGVSESTFPTTTVAFVLKAGSIHNTSYLGIPYNAPNASGAMVVINYFLSPEAQIAKSDPRNIGSAPVFDYNRLEGEWQQKYDAVPKLSYGISEAAIQHKAIKETASQYMINIADDFRKKVIETK